MTRLRRAAIILSATTISLMTAQLADANTINAASASEAHVQAAIDSAVSGDTVRVPEGTATWTEGVSIPDAKKIAVIGAGWDRTVITSSTSGNIVYLNQSGSRLSGFSFVLPSTGYGPTVGGEGWRIDHCHFTNTSGSSRDGIYAFGGSQTNHPIGLVDNCEFFNCRVVVVGDASLLAHRIWAEPLGLGTNNAVFIEDCAFTRTISGNSIDSNYGGRYVFRHNIVNDSTAEVHSVQGNHRASRSWEIYSNMFNQVSRSMWAPMFLRGGTGVVFNNTVSGTWNNLGFALDNVRSMRFAEDPPGFDFPPGNADGTSTWDGNTQPTETYHGWPCRDQIGRSTDEWLWTTGNPFPKQQSDPAYFWNNKHGSNDVLPFRHNTVYGGIPTYVPYHVQEGRDYFVGIPRPGYTPYTYPHPLIQEWEKYGGGGGSGGSTPAAPTGLRLKN